MNFTLENFLNNWSPWRLRKRVKIQQSIIENRNAAAALVEKYEESFKKLEKIINDFKSYTANTYARK